jgi:hypothetical protein
MWNKSRFMNPFWRHYSCTFRPICTSWLGCYIVLNNILFFWVDFQKCRRHFIFIVFIHLSISHLMHRPESSSDCTGREGESALSASLSNYHPSSSGHDPMYLETADMGFIVLKTCWHTSLRLDNAAANCPAQCSPVKSPPFLWKIW